MQVTHNIENVTPNDKSMNLRAILLEKTQTIELKNGDTIS